MSDCCNVPQQTAIETPSEKIRAAQCVECGGVGRSVTRQTVFLHVRSEELERVSGEAYRFCACQNCPVVYYGEEGGHFTVEDVREIVTAKASGEERPLCYCFGFNEGQAREQIAFIGTSAIPAQISRYIKEGMCACEVRNPSGACCLGQVNQAIKRLIEEYKAASESTLEPVHDYCSR